MRAYADFSTLISNKLADSAQATFSAADINFQIEESLKEVSQELPHLVYISFDIESRYGTASSTSANNLVDTTKGQFLTTDDDNEKVVYNRTDKTWATITSVASTSQVGLSADIFTSGEEYEIYNKRCVNAKQIYIGDMPEILKPIRAEYPTQCDPREWRNIRLEHGGEVLEIDVDSVDNSDSTLSPPGRTKVIVEFSKPHVLCQLTDLSGEVANTAGYSAAATSIALDGLGDTETIEIGDEFHLENHRSLYVITVDVTTSGNAATISFFPGLEAALSDNDDITFIGSTLKPDYEDILADLATGELMINKAPKYIRTVTVGGAATWRNYLEAGRIKVEDARHRLRKAKKWQTYQRYSTER